MSEVSGHHKTEEPYVWIYIATVLLKAYEWRNDVSDGGVLGKSAFEKWPLSQLHDGTAMCVLGVRMKGICHSSRLLAFIFCVVCYYGGYPCLHLVRLRNE